MAEQFPARIQTGRRVQIPPEALDELDAEVGDHVVVKLEDFNDG